MKWRRWIRPARPPTSWHRPRAPGTSSSICRCAASTMSSRKPPRCWSAHRLPDTRENPRPLSIDWVAAVPGVREHEPLGPHSWYGIGGHARYFLALEDDTALAELIARLT